MNNIYEESFKIYTWDVDSEDKLKISSAFNYCQEAAGIHATKLGVGVEFMRSQGIAWVLSRMSLELSSRPAWGSILRLKTWPRGTEKLFAIRDYELLLQNGQTIGRGRAAWLIVDTENMRPRRPEAIAEKLPLNPDQNALTDGAKAIKQEEDLVKVFSRTASYTDIDYNKHVNNARYAQWVEDAIPEGLLSGANGLRLDINYLAELLLEEKLEILSANVHMPQSPDLVYSVEGRKTDQKPSFRAEFRLKK